MTFIQSMLQTTTDHHIDTWEMIRIIANALTYIIAALITWIGFRLKRLEARQDKLDDDFVKFREFYIERHSELKDLQLEIQKLRTDLALQMGELKTILAKEYMTKQECKFVQDKGGN